MSDQPQRVFVTGGRGRLASLIADHFRAPAHHVELFSRVGAPGFRTNADLLRPGGLEGCATLLHLAWSTLPASSEAHPGSEERHDLPQLEQLLDALAAVPTRSRTHFVFFSTGGAVYGNAPGRPNREDDACAPVGRYGRAKLAAEQLIRARAERDGLPCTILRISNPYGYPVPKSRQQGLIAHALRCAVEGQSLTLWGDGRARKDFLYYTDFLSALELVVARRLCGVFNLAAGESHSVEEIIALVEAATEKKIRLTRTPAPTWDVQDSRLDNSRLAAATGWQPQVALAEGIRRAAAGYAGH
ncbi:NAD-dependent epimerase/dehydratase family protein [Oleiharenicola sp. Vm1]|uniref:NAD-dependent epimerase/dehydratase family protein n=1 Tax=Oleiharenicola sp. Vm1 TaxID=3398393 RepID=UPI0039F516FD